MSDESCKQETSPCKPSAKPEYDIPRSNSYMTLSLCTMKPQSPEERKKLRLPNLPSSLDERAQLDEPQYASPDEMKVMSNKAYAVAAVNNRGVRGGGGGDETPTQLNSDTHFYALPSDVPPLTTTIPTAQSKTKSKEQEQHLLKFRMALCFSACALAIFLSIGLGATSLALVLFSPANSPHPQPCDCLAYQQQQEEDHTQFIDSLQDVQQRLDRATQEAEESRIQVTTLTSIVRELSKNTSTLLESLESENPTKSMATLTPTRNVTGVLHNCTSTVEETCTVPINLGVCTTNCVPEFKDNNKTIAINFECTKLESLEQNPLIGVLDVTGGQAFCFCYVIEVHGRTRTHLVDCGLRVTRCSLTDLQG